MVLSATRRVSNSKENSAEKNPLLRAKSAARAQRKCGRPYKASLAPSKERHQASHTEPVVAGPSTLSLAIEDDAHASLETVSSADSPQRKILLPRELQRPAFRPISSAAISAIDANLAEVPIEYIRQKLKDVGEQMLITTTKVTAECPKGRLPHELEIVINDTSSDAPTHVLAIYSQPSPFQKQRITLHPIHALVLVAHCANLPRLPHSQFQEGASIVTLPVLPLCLPSPQTFSLLLAYLYTHRAQDILSALLPITTGDLSPHDQLQKLIETCTLSTILSSVYTTHGLWSNVVALGVFDDTLWRFIDYAWGTLLDAIAAKTGESWHTQ